MNLGKTASRDGELQLLFRSLDLQTSHITLIFSTDNNYELRLGLAVRYQDIGISI